MSRPLPSPRALFGRLLANPVQLQHDEADCAPACLRMIALHHGRVFSLADLRRRCDLGRSGASIRSLARAAESIGFRSLSAKVPLDRLSELPVPLIAHWQQSHFVLVEAVSESAIDTIDPAVGRIRYTRAEFARSWVVDREQGRGVVLLLEPTPALRSTEALSDEETSDLRHLLAYLWPHRAWLGQVLVAMGVSAGLSLLAPILMQALVDIGIGFHDLPFLYLVLAAQIALYVGQATIALLRARLLVQIGQRVNVALLSDLVSKLLRLPVAFFGTRRLSDVLQRVEDHRRIEQFLTSGLLNLALSIGTLAVFSVVLTVYDVRIFLFFVVGSAMAGLWVMAFASRRRALDYRRFAEAARVQNALIQMIDGLEEIRVADCAEDQRWTWQRAQGRLFAIGLESLSVEQLQNTGSNLIGELRNAAITLTSALLVIDGQMSFGTMMAVQFIVGQASTPIRDLFEFGKRLQDARTGWERSREVHLTPDEETADTLRLAHLPEDRTIRFHDVHFRYPGPEERMVLDGVDLEIPAGKVTAIVGASGSGKTTMLKLLLKLYAPTGGSITVGGLSLSQISNAAWRRATGAVLQDGYLFAESIARNVCLRDGELDLQELERVAQVSNLLEVLSTRALGWDTRVGAGGSDLSHGQRQRVLIARALYGPRELLLFDEATSSLDATNEREIMERLELIFAGKTVVVVAHRLSTVRRADQIVVLDRGTITERGTHEQLVERRGRYYDLVKNQLELGR